MSWDLETLRREDIKLESAAGRGADKWGRCVQDGSIFS